MLCLASFSSLAWIEPLIGQRGHWLTHNFEWVVLGIAGVLALAIFCSIAAAGMALLCSLALLLRESFGTLMDWQHSPMQLMPGPPEPSQAQGQADVKLLPLGVKEGKWAK